MTRRPLLAALAASLLAVPARALPVEGTAEGDKLEAASGYLERMKSALNEVLGRAEQARQEKDIVKLNCVVERLAQVKGLIRIAEQADLSLHESVAAKGAGREAELSKIAIATTKTDVLRSESERCIGQLAFHVAEKTVVHVDEPAGVASPSAFGVEREGRASDAANGLASTDGRSDTFDSRDRGRWDRFSEPLTAQPPPPIP